MSLPQAAVTKAKSGWAVFPLASGTKIPAIAGGHGCKDATCDVSIVEAWWQTWPSANIGILCGPAPVGSGVWVLDVDGPEGRASLQALTDAHGELPTTLVVETPSGGQHWYFSYPPGRTIRNAVRLKGPDGTRIPGLDVRSAGGYVVAPPSVVDGKPYVASSRRMPAEAPPWLLDLVDPPKAEVLPKASPVKQETATTRQIAWARAALDGACRNLASMPEGGRNDAANRSIMAMAGYAAAGLLDVTDARARLEAACTASGLDAREVALLMRSGGPWDAGFARPQVPDLEDRPMPSGRHHHEDDEAINALLSDVDTKQDGTPPAEAPRYTDLGNATRLVDRYGRDLRYCGPAGGWLVWDGARWVVDDLCRAKEYAKAIPAVIRDEADRLEADLGPPTPKDKNHPVKQARAWANASESIGRQEAMVRLAESDGRIATRKGAFNADRWTLCAANGTVNLRDGATRDHLREDLMTRKANANLNPRAKCPTWDAFLLRVLGGDPDLVAFVQRAVGYSLVGTTDANAMFILWGNGANGKSTFVETLRYVLGDYAVDTPAETFIVKQSGQIPTDLAALDGARLVTAAELGDGKQLDESLIKRATGGDPITARFMRQDFFTFQPQFTLWMSTNHRPIIRGVDEGIWRRLKLIPFVVTIPVEERDLDLGRKLRDEADGILTWALLGLASYQEIGLREPQAVLAAVSDYRSEMDMLSDFIADKCERDLMSSVSNSDLYKAYAAWARDLGETHIWSHKTFSRQMTARGFKQAAGRMDGRRWVGIRVVSEGRGWGARPEIVA